MLGGCNMGEGGHRATPRFLFEHEVATLGCPCALGVALVQVRCLVSCSSFIPSKCSVVIFDFKNYQLLEREEGVC